MNMHTSPVYCVFRDVPLPGQYLRRLEAVAKSVRVGSLLSALHGSELITVLWLLGIYPFISWHLVQ